MLHAHPLHRFPAPEDRRAVIILDYSEKSSAFLRNFIEAKKELELNSLLKIDYDVVNSHTIHAPPEPGGGYPLMYIDGMLVSMGKVPSVEELVAMLLNPRPIEVGEGEAGLPTWGEEPPWFGAAASA